MSHPNVMRLATPPSFRAGCSLPLVKYAYEVPRRLVGQGLFDATLVRSIGQVCEVCQSSDALTGTNHGASLPTVPQSYIE